MMEFCGRQWFLVNGSRDQSRAIPGSNAVEKSMFSFTLSEMPLGSYWGFTDQMVTK